MMEYWAVMNACEEIESRSEPSMIAWGEIPGQAAGDDSCAGLARRAEVELNFD